MANIDVRGLVDRLGELSARIGALLMELDDERQRHTSEAGILRGSSEAAWQQGTQMLAELWTAFQQTSDRVQSWTARCGAGRISSTVADEVAQEVIESRAEEAASALFDRVQWVAERITAIWAVRDVCLPRLAEIGERLDRIEVEARDAGVRVPNETATIRDELARLRSDAMVDPLAVPVQLIVELAARVERVAGNVAEEVQRAERVDADLRALDEALDQLATALAEARLQESESAGKIAGPPETDSDLIGLSDTVELLRGELSAAQSGGDRRQKLALVDQLRQRVDRLRDAVTSAIEQASAGLRARRELRGRLGAYRAKAMATGRAEDLALERLFLSASDALYSAPCDLEEAERRVTEYQRSVQKPPGRPST